MFNGGIFGGVDDRGVGDPTTVEPPPGIGVDVDESAEPEGFISCPPQLP